MKEKVGPASDAVWETELEEGGDISIYNPSTEEVTVLNNAGSDIWRLADGEHTIEEIIELLASAYRVNPEEIARDVAATVTRFTEAGLLKDG